MPSTEKNTTQELDNYSIACIKNKLLLAITSINLIDVLNTKTPTAIIAAGVFADAVFIYLKTAKLDLFS
ncbi:MAG: hypothetical protein ACRYFL_16735 [Janthinobacterium lividum]